ncbi:MAG: protein kinase [Steroidobacteraceae bacterium]
MTPGTDPARRAEPRPGNEGALLAWLDALVSGNCTDEEFLVAVRNHCSGDSDQTWEVVSLLDQYYRRGKIKTDLFLTLKSRLEDSALDNDEDLGASLAATVAARLAASPPVHASAPLRASSGPSGLARVPTLPTAEPPRPPSAAARTSAAPPSPSTLVTSPVAAAPTMAPAAPAAAPRSAPPRNVAIGDVLRQRYKVVGLLGQGGMGTVFEAVDEYRVDLPTTSQRLAIKVLHTAVSQREELLSQLQREFQHLQLLSHPNIVRVHEFDRDGDIAFFTMEFLNGALLSQVLGARKAVALPRPYVLAIMRDIGAALAHAHSQGVVHGDINPQNVFITNGGELRVLDFGASHRMLRDRWTSDIRLSERAPVATQGYASCQLLEGQYPDARDDLFAFACVAYVLLWGRHPFPNRTAVEACAQRLRPARPPGLTNRQWRVLREGLRWERDRRPADVGQWLDRFDLSGAAPRLPKLPLLVNSPSQSNWNVKRTAGAILAAALLAAACYFAVTNYDSLAQHLMAWTGQAPSAGGDANKLPEASAPAVTAPTATAPTVGAPPITGQAMNPPRVAAASPKALSKSTHPTATLSALMASPISPANAAAAPKTRLAAAARTSAGSASTRAANAGPVRIELAADTVDVEPSDTTASVVVSRKGTLHGEASFTWWTESGTAKPGHDFSPVTPRMGQIDDGSASTVLIIPVSGAPRTRPKSFYVVIDRTDSGPALGARTLTMVTLQPPDQPPP